MNTPTIQAARWYAMYQHDRTNHRYGDQPYWKHLEEAASLAMMWWHACGLTEEEAEIAIAGAWVHDIIEDARQSYNDVVEVVGKKVAEVAYALTNNKGRTRDDRADDAYYAGIRMNRIFVFVKGCDRLANVSNAVRTGNHKMLGAYRSEHSHFCRILDVLRPEPLSKSPLEPLFMEITLKFLGDSSCIDLTSAIDRMRAEGA